MSKSSKIIVSLLVFPMVLSGGAVLAEEIVSVTMPADPEVVIPNIGTEIDTVADETKADKIKATGAKLIAERVRILGQLKVKIKKSNLLVKQKEDLIGQIDNLAAKLRTLAMNAKNETNAGTARQEVSSIITDYRTYAVFIPQIHYKRSIYALENYSTNLDSTFARMQFRINTFKAKGRDVAKAQANLSQAKVIKDQAVTSLIGLKAKVEALKPSDYPASKKTFAEIKTEVRSIQNKFDSVRQLIGVKRVAAIKADQGFTTLPAN